jgi:hypothetical protein
VSLAAPGSTFYANKAQYLVGGKFGLNYKPYIVLSGTSMAAPVVAGTVAMMFQANPNLTPNLVKAILQYTAQQYPGYNSLRQGAGFLNTLGAVRLASFYKDNKAGARMPVQPVWSRQIIWGNHRVKGGYLNPKANAWALSTLWGAAQTFDFDNIIWGTDCPDVSCDNIIWGTVDALFDNIIWGTEDVLDNIIWGTEFVGDNIIWGTADADNVIWGTNCGGADCDNIIWGTASESDNIIWGTAEQGASVVWLQNGLDNVIWGTSAEEDVTWGSSSPDEVIYPDESTEPLPDMLLELGEQPAAPPASEEPAADSDSGLLTNLIGGGL